MTLHQLFAYYVAHAPATPHAWFKPVIEPEPAKPKVAPGTNLGGLVGKSVCGWFPDPDCPSLTADESAFANAANEYTKAHALWKERYAAEASRQWPIAFAKEMLAQHPEAKP